MSVLIKVLASGRIACYKGKVRQHRMWEELPLAAGPARREVIRQLEPALVKATRRIFGSEFTPANFNEIFERRVWVRQVMSDCPQLMPVAYAFITQNHLSATPKLSIISRLKAMLQRKGAQDFKRHPGGGAYMALDSKGRKRRDSEVNNFWNSYSDFDNPALSEAGWRYLHRLPSRTQNAVSAHVWKWTSDYIPLFSVLGELGLPAVPPSTFEVLRSFWPQCAGEYSRHNMVRLVVERYAREGESVGRQELDVLRDWFYEEQRTIQPGTRWETLTARAFDEAGLKAEKTRSEVEAYVWQAPIEPFVADDGFMVVPLSNGVQLLEEGLEMNNCLSSRDSYAKRAVEGLSQVFSVRGVKGRYTAEFARHSLQSPWYLAQVEGREGEKVRNPVALRIVQKIENTLNGGA